MKFLNQIKEEIHPSWENFINDKEVLKELEKIEEKIGNNYYPKTKDVLKFLKTDLNNVKCVIVGMDPYRQETKNNDPLATGRSFEVNGYDNWMNKTRKSSLNNILKAIYLSVYEKESKENISIAKVRKEIENNNFNILPPNELFDNLEKQGVLFLNYGLTVDKNKSGSHLIYWKKFSLMLTKYILKNTKDVKWMLWGSEVQKVYCNIIPPKNQILNSHPRTKSFLSDNSFDKIDSIDFTGTKKR